MNVGFFPEEGKYNRTACTRCYEQYTLEQAEEFQLAVPERQGLIKKGVRDRAGELSSGTPVKRPPYLHMLPLGEIIGNVHVPRQPTQKNVLPGIQPADFGISAMKLQSSQLTPVTGDQGV